MSLRLAHSADDSNKLAATPVPHPLLAEASHRHLLGGLAQAETLYLSILRERAEDADALFLLGTLYLQMAAWEQAIPCFGRLITFHPQHVDGFFHLGFAYQEKGEVTSAEQCYQAAIKLSPTHVFSRSHLADLLAAQGKHQPALVHYLALTELEPKQATHHTHCALLYQAMGQEAAAEQALGAALALDSCCVPALLTLGALLLETQRYAEAEIYYVRARELDSQLAEAEQGLGSLRFLQYRYAEAYQHLSQAAQLKPNQPDILCNLGATLRKLARFDAAENDLRQALAIDPQHADAHFNLSVVLLQQGKMAEGWVEYEWRFRIKGRAPVVHEQPVWDGSPLAGKTILIRAEQGFGDTFNFLRYLPLLKARGARVIFECQPGLRRLLMQCPYIDVLVERTPSFVVPSDFDVHAMLMSLPRIMQTTLETLPPASPYLKPEACLLQRWQARLANDAQFKVGMVWSGKLTHEDNPNRRCPLECFAPLVAIPGLSIYSLQKGEAAAQFRQQPWADPLNDLHDELRDFADTAAAISALDWVVTVDTSVAHLAGALGKPVSLLLSDAPDWRWLADRDDSPWYPSMRLFRQTAHKDWEAPLTKLCAELRMAVARPRVTCLASTSEALAYPPLLLASLHQIREAQASGNLGLAQYELEAIVNSTPQHAEANFLLGELLLQHGQAEGACLPLTRAQQTWPDHPHLLKLLGMTAQARGDCPEATRYLERALNTGNEDGASWHAFGQCCQQMGLHAEALRAYRRSLDWQPEWAEVADKVGQLLQGMGQVDQAIDFYLRALHAEPDYFPAHFHLGNTLFSCGRHAAAEASLRCAMELNPAYAPVRNNLGVALKAAGRLHEAECELREAVRLDPTYSEAYNNLGNVLVQQDRLREAEDAFQIALSHDPSNAQAYNNLGISMQALGAVDAALQCYDTATMLRPKFAAAHWNRALLLLLRGDYAAGFSEYEWGFESGARLRLPLATPLWQGSAEPAKTLLVHTEQGFGDTLQFVRFLRLAKPRVGRLVLCCQAGLVDLLAHSLLKMGWVDAVVSEAAAVPAHDYSCGLMSLPHILQSGPHEIVLDAPYIHVDCQHLPQLALPPHALKVGLVWAGLPTHQNNQRRSIGITPFKRLLKIPKVFFYSLQKGPGETELEEVGTLVHNLAPFLNDFADTAAAIAQLDLVITVDTSVAHLAGAMGKAVWVLLPFAPDWRWGLNHAESKWYPTLKLFRQTQSGGWGKVFDDVALELANLHLR
jgi:tetratricopeptide (TPR) repeat protein